MRTPRLREPREVIGIDPEQPDTFWPGFAYGMVVGLIVGLVSTAWWWAESLDRALR